MKADEDTWRTDMRANLWFEVWWLVLNPSILLLDISTGDLKSPSSWKKANSWAVQKRCISLHIHHTSNHCTQWMNAHHSHSLAWGQTRLVALMWNTSPNKAACKQKILFTGRLFSITEHALIHTTLNAAIAVVIAILFATRVPTVSTFAIAVINIGLNIGVIRASHRSSGVCCCMVF